MNTTDPIADLLTRIRNIMIVKRDEVIIPYSKMKERILEIFKNEGYIKSYRITTDQFRKNLVVYLKYTHDGSSVIRGLEKVSVPGRRLYVKPKNIRPVLGGVGTGVVSTSSGLKTVKHCIRENIGGEYICKIW